jgi:restriction endonuclease S subunit
MDTMLANNPVDSTLEPITEARKLVRKSAQMAVDVRAQMAVDIHAQMAAIMNVSQTGAFVTTLNELCNCTNGKTLAKTDKTDTGEYDVMGGGKQYNGKYTNYNRDGETISISKSGASSGFITYHTKKYWAGDCFTVTPKHTTTCRIRYLYHFLKCNSNLTMSTAVGGIIPHCKWDDIKTIRVPIPPISVQEDIIMRINMLESQLAMLTSLQNQTESNARFLLNSYLKVELPT